MKVLYMMAFALDSEATRHQAHIPDYAKIDEIPFDFERRIMSVVVRTPEGKDRIISKGAPDAIFPRCKNFELDGEISPMRSEEHTSELQSRQYLVCRLLLEKKNRHRTLAP